MAARRGIEPSFQVENLSGFPHFPNVFNSLTGGKWFSDRVGTAWLSDGTV